MATALMDPPMVDEKAKTQPVKLHTDVIETARIVSAYRSESMADMLSNILRPILAEMERDEVARRAKAPKGKGPK